VDRGGDLLHDGALALQPLQPLPWTASRIGGSRWARKWSAGQAESHPAEIPLEGRLVVGHGQVAALEGSAASRRPAPGAAGPRPPRRVMGPTWSSDQDRG